MSAKIPHAHLDAESVSEINETIGLLLHQVRLRLIRHLECDLAAGGFGINFSQYRVLRTLAQREFVSPTEISRCCGHDAGALTRMLDRLQEKGYLRRVPRTDDRRAVDVTLTEAGRAVWREIQACGSALSSDALSDLSDTEQQQLFEMLKKVRVTLDQRPYK